MRYCININQIKSNQIKSNRELYTLTNNFLKIFLIALLSFIALFFVSCNENVYKPFGYDIPNILGSPDCRLFDFHEGDFKLAKLEVSPETEKNMAEAEVTFPATYSGKILFIGDSKYWVDAPHSTITNATLYGYGEYKSHHGISDYSNYNARIDNGNVKSYIKFTHNVGSGGVIYVTDYIVAMITNGMSIRATYTATLLDLPPHY